MRISIAVPSFNYRKYLAKCLDSIVMQDHQDYEVLICDAGSTDGSREIIDDYVQKDGRFRLISQSDSGQSDAVDKAFKQAAGQVLCFLNADDFYLSNHVFSRVVETFRHYPDVSIINFESVFVDEGGKALRLVKSRIHPMDSLSWIKYRGQIVQPSTFWLRKVYDQHPFHTHWHYCFDSAFFYDAYQSFSFLELPGVMAAYRLHSTNKSVGVSWKRIAELAEFEQYKFGTKSLRAWYLRMIARLVLWASGVPFVAIRLQRALYVAVNALSVMSWHRLPNV